MTVRCWIGILALGLAVALPAAASAGASTGDEAQSKTHTTATKTKTGGQKGAAKAGKGGKKSKGGVAYADEDVSDSSITTKIKADFVNEATLKGSNINVDTKDTVVTLNGTVPSEAGKARAEQIAKETQGVTKVVDNLTVK